MEWISVKDRLPEKDGKTSIYCLVVDKGDVCVLPFNEYHDCWDQDDGDDYYCHSTDGRVTHWMPLPKPPKSDE